MRHFSFDELDFTVHDPIEVSGGSRPRLVVEHTRTKQRYFLKSYRHTPREVWTEMLASQLGELVGINIQAVSLKRIPAVLTRLFKTQYGSYLPSEWKPVASLVRNIFPKNIEILYGRNIVGTASEPVRLEDIEKNVRARYLDSEDILQNFAEMVVFDAWIGNMDRHHENWAIWQKDVLTQFSLFKPTIEEREQYKKLRGFSGLFDHGSSLMFELSDEDVKRYTDDKQLLERSYILGKKYALILASDGSHKNIYQIIGQHIATPRTKWGKRFVSAIIKLEKANSLSVARLILQMPTAGVLEFSQERKQLLYYSLERRRQILENYCALEEVNDENSI